MRRQVLIVVFVSLLLRLPFLNQAVLLDDVYYLAAARHAQQDPWHPHHARYVFLGDMVDMRGHPHPPLNAWYLAALTWALGEERIRAFRLAYVLFTVAAALATLLVARRFTTRPLLAALLFMTTPAFVIEGNSFMSDLPFLAWWMAAVALCLRAVETRGGWWLAACAGALAGAALTAYQAVFLIPVLWLYLWWFARDWKAAWAISVTPALAAAGYQLFERLSSGTLPAQLMSTYFSSYGLQTLENKIRNALALTAHAGWLLFPPLAVAAFRNAGRWVWVAAALATLAAAFADPHPMFWVSFGVGALVVGTAIRGVWPRQAPNPATNRKPGEEAPGMFLCGWIALFLGGALVIFFAGAARYLLPIAAPIALLATRRLEGRPAWLWTGLAAQLLLSLSLGWTSYVHWDGYRRFARLLAAKPTQGDVWINGEWGLRHYIQEYRHGRPLRRGQRLRPGDILVSSELAYPVPYNSGGVRLEPLEREEIATAFPLRLMGLNAKSAYTTISFGLRPFDVSGGPFDVVRADLAVELIPRLSLLPMNAPEATEQIVSGIYGLENGQWRWTSGQAVLLLKPPSGPAPLRVEFAIPEGAPGRQVLVTVDGATVAEETYAAAGSYDILTRPLMPKGARAMVVIRIDKTFSPPGDARALGMILTAVGFQSHRRLDPQP